MKLQAKIHRNLLCGNIFIPYFGFWAVAEVEQKCTVCSQISKNLIYRLDIADGKSLTCCVLGTGKPWTFPCLPVHDKSLGSLRHRGQVNGDVTGLSRTSQGSWHSGIWAYMSCIIHETCTGDRCLKYGAIFWTACYGSWPLGLPHS